MIKTRRRTPWLHRWSRVMVGIIATLGAIETLYLTVAHVLGEKVACPTSGCEEVLTSPYASVFGIPLALLGFLAYATVAVLSLGPLLIQRLGKMSLGPDIEDGLAWLQFAITTAMLVSSAYLVYLMAFKIDAWCVYCLTSALLSLSLWILTVAGRPWRDAGQLLMTAVVVLMVGVVGILAAYNSVDGTAVAQNPRTTGGTLPPVVSTVSGPAEIALAKHLTKVGAREFGAYWCPHCHEQKQLFGAEAAKYLTYIECDPSGANSQTRLCETTGIRGFPTWEIGGKLYPGVRDLSALADLTGYQGPRNFARQYQRQPKPGS